MSEAGNVFGKPPVSDGVKPSARWRIGLVASIVAMVIGCVAAAGGLVAVVGNVGQYRIPSPAMSPTLQSGDLVFIRRDVAETVQRGDIVVFRADVWSGVDDPEARFVKRVVAIGGDTVRCCHDDGRIVVNDVPVDEPYLRDGDAQDAAFAAAVPVRSVFVLGDWRSSSRDSRHEITPDGKGGAIPVEDIQGIVVAVNSKALTPTTAFADAGLPSTRTDDLIPWPLIIGIAVAAALGLIGLVGLVGSLLWRSRTD